MKKMLKVAEGAYYVPSYPEITVITFQKATNNQTIIVSSETQRDDESSNKKEEIKEAQKRLY